jgi:FlaA1/EpsC-like NDP-sugar epimerase
LKANFKNIPYEIVIADVRNFDRMKRVFDYFKPQVVFHAAAYKHVPLMENNPAESVLTNVIGTKNIADLSLTYQVEKFILISTDKAVNPTNVMGATKRMAELYIQTLNNKGKTKYIVTRFGNVLGSNGSVIPLFKRQIERGGPVTVTHPEITRYFMTIPEACQLVLQAAAIGNGGEVFVFDMGKSVKIVDLAKKMIKLSGLELGKDIQIVFTGLRPGEKLYEELLADKENTLPTPHEKIMIAKVAQPESHVISQALVELEQSVKEQDNVKLVKILKQVIPEYKSINSVFENLDN